jgi:hypothetical protein
VESTLETLGGERDALDAHREDVRGLLSSARPEAQETAVEPVADGERSEPDAEAPSSWANEADEAESQDRVEAHGSDADAMAADAEDGRAASGAQPRRTSVTPDWLGVMTPANVPTIPADGGFHDAVFPDDTEKLEFTSPEESSNDAADVFGNATSSGRDAPEAPASGSSAAATSGAFDELAFLRSVIDPQAPSPSAPSKPAGGDAQKTLRCTECGTMNLPTEWYCERCGGELAAF